MKRDKHNPLQQADRRVRYIHSESRGYFRSYRRLWDWLRNAPVDHLLLLTLRFPVHLLGSIPAESAAWSSFAREVLRGNAWIVDWVRVFEGMGKNFHVHVVLRSDAKVGSFVWKLGSQRRIQIAKSPAVARLQHQLLCRKYAGKLFRFHFKRVYSVKKISFYLTKEQRERGKRKVSRPQAMKGRRIIAFMRKTRTRSVRPCKLRPFSKPSAAPESLSVKI